MYITDPHNMTLAIKVALNSIATNQITTQIRLLMTLKKMPFENKVGKAENADDQPFLLFLQCFLPILIRFSAFRSLLFFLLSSKCFQFGPI